MNSYQKILFIAVVPWSIQCYAQDHPSQDPDLEAIIEYFAPQDDDVNYEELYENLAQLMSHPINLNKASAEELNALNLLTGKQVQEIIDHRARFGNFISVYELQVLPSFNTELLQAISPFITIHERTTAQALHEKVLESRNNYLALRFDRSLNPQTPVATDSTRQHLGSPTRMFSRFRISSPGQFSMGFTLEKDAGEQLRMKRFVPGFDYWSAHLQWKGTRWMRNIIVGDFTAQFGQGLVLGSGFGAGKGSETILTVRRSSLGFLPYTAATEHSFFRGTALTLAPARFVKLHLFASNLRRDASIKGDSSTYITAFDVSGFHRTITEMARRKTMSEQNAGAILEMNGNQWQAGVLTHFVAYSEPLLPEPNHYNQFRFHGDRHSSFAAYATYGWQNFSFFSEAAGTIQGRKGAIAGLIGSLSSRFDVSVLLRNYQPGYYSPYANALSENTFPENERGVYWGWKYQPRRRLLMSGYVDLFEFPWLRFRAYRPAAGMESLLRITMKPARGVEISMQGREERKERNTSAGSWRHLPGPIVKRNFFVSATCDGGKVKWRTRAQMSAMTEKLTGTTTTGFVILQDVSANMGKLSFAGRMALFGTDDFDNRQYVYEPDVWSAFSFPAYYGEGIRSMAMLRYKVSRHLDVWVRWSRTTYATTFSARADGSLPEGTREDVKVQVRIRL